MVSGTHLTPGYSEHAKETARRYRFVAARRPVSSTDPGQGDHPPFREHPSRKAVATTTMTAERGIDILA
jgi:hypothetical protein